MRLLSTWAKVTAVLIVAFLIYSSVSGFYRQREALTKVSVAQTQLAQLVRVECERSAHQAALRAKIINDLTKHVATPSLGSPAGLFLTVKNENLQLDAEKKDLTTVGSKIPPVVC